MDNLTEREPIPGETDYKSTNNQETEELKNEKTENQDTQEQENSPENLQEQEDLKQQKEANEKTRHDILYERLKERFATDGTKAIVQCFKDNMTDDKSIAFIHNLLSEKGMELDIKNVFTEMEKFDINTIESDNPAHKETLQNIIYEMIVDNPNLGGENINLLARKWIIKKPEKENQTGYDEIAFFNRETHEININPELFDDQKYSSNIKHVILHEFSHALTLEPNLIYDKEPAPDLTLMAQMVKNPEKYIGTQGQWMDELLKDKKIKPGMIIEEIMAERSAEYLASGGNETKMLYNHLSMFSGESLQNLQNKVGKENLDALKLACATNDTEKIKEFNDKFPEFKQIIEENKIFFNRFNDKLKNKSPQDLRAIINENIENQEYYDEFFDDLFGDEFEGGMFSGEISEPGEMGSQGSGKGLLDSIKEIFEPLKQAIGS